MGDPFGTSSTMAFSLAAQALQNVLGAVAYMHSKNVVHRDLTPSNLLLPTRLPADKVSPPHLRTPPPPSPAPIKHHCPTSAVCGQGQRGAPPRRLPPRPPCAWAAGPTDPPPKYTTDGDPPEWHGSMTTRPKAWQRGARDTR